MLKFAAARIGTAIHAIRAHWRPLKIDAGCGSNEVVGESTRNAARFPPRFMDYRKSANLGALNRIGKSLAHPTRFERVASTFGAI